MGASLDSELVSLSNGWAVWLLDSGLLECPCVVVPCRLSSVFAFELLPGALGGSLTVTP